MIRNQGMLILWGIQKVQKFFHNKIDELVLQLKPKNGDGSFKRQNIGVVALLYFYIKLFWIEEHCINLIKNYLYQKLKLHNQSQAAQATTT